MQEIEKLVEAWKSEVLSEACLNGCDHVCCSMNFDLDEEQLRLFFGMKGETYVPKRKTGSPLVRKNDSMLDGRRDGTFRTDFLRGKEYCPMYDGGRCRIHESSLRPKVCADFPIFIYERDKQLVYKPSCIATRPELISGLFLGAIDLGYKVFDGIAGIEFLMIKEENIIR